MCLLILHLLLLEYNTILCSSLHGLGKVPIVLFSVLALAAYVIVYGNDAGETVSHLVHVHLEDVLAFHQTKAHAQEPIPPFVGVECCKI